MYSRAIASARSAESSQNMRSAVSGAGASRPWCSRKLLRYAVSGPLAKISHGICVNVIRVAPSRAACSTDSGERPTQ